MNEKYRETLKELAHTLINPLRYGRPVVSNVVELAPLAAPLAEVIPIKEASHIELGSE